MEKMFNFEKKYVENNSKGTNQSSAEVRQYM